MAIDLTKLKALELPSKDIEVEILGEKQTVKIVCPGEDVASAISLMYNSNPDNPTLSIDVIRKLVSAALPELSDDERQMLCKADFKAATVIAAAARDLLIEFTQSKKKCHEDTEKNLPAAESTPEVNF